MKLQKLKSFCIFGNGKERRAPGGRIVLSLLKVVVCLALMEISTQLISRKILTMNYLLL